MSPAKSLAAAIAMLAGAALAGPAFADVVVSSKIDTEGSVLGNIILLALEASGVRTVDRIQLGGTPVVRAALIAGEIDIYPEYTGNAAFFFEQGRRSPLERRRRRLRGCEVPGYAANRIVWLKPSPADNAWAIALRKDVAAANGLKTLGDFGRWATAGGKVVLAASAEFVNAPSGLPAFQSAYDFKLSSRQLVILVGRRHGGDDQGGRAPDQRRRRGHGLQQRWRDQASGLVILADDRHVQPIYARLRSFAKRS